MDRKFKVDDLVILDPEVAGKHRGTVWRVKSPPRGRNGVNYVLDNHSHPGEPGLRAEEYLLRPAPAGGSTPTVTFEPYVAPPLMGAVVRVADPSPRKKIPAAELFVVVKIGDRINIVRLGGSHRFWRVPAGWLTVVPLTEVADKLAAHSAVVGSTAS